MRTSKIIINIIKYLLTAVIIGLYSYWGYLWLNEYKEYKVVDILASREPELGVPVYAQFTVSQTFTIPEQANVTEIIIPAYLPEKYRPIKVNLIQENEKIFGWKMRDDINRSAGIHDMKLPFPEPLNLQGKFILNLNGKEIRHDEKENAPRVFVEKDDSKYKPGSYRIADNNKKGDISMKVIARHTRLQEYIKEWSQDYSKAIITISQWLLLLLTLAVLPHVLLRDYSKDAKNKDNLKTT